MSQDKIESRRAFMKKLGKLAGTTVVAAAFMTTISKETVAQPDEDNPPTDCSASYCGFECANSCFGSCTGRCGASSCGHTCSVFVMFK